jgi:UDP-N-acetylglucosamine diphosphorylase / glucose-1-phosphate thymidylyltransferase / UDP-N-acetylgalactosamine diphosphorylase / glucosamine-1-phosphate N-acetyltransferase / galactosamine-1-phosphate N-acetyltransferase
MADNLKPNYFFENSDLVKNIEFVWDIIPNIRTLIENKIKNNNEIIIGENSIISEGAVIEPPVIIGKNTKISNKAVIEGYTIIGDNCEIRSGSYIRGNVVIGNNCIIRSEMKNSIIMNNSNAAHLSYIGDSIIGENCNLGAGTILSNLKLGENNIILKINDQKHDTGLKKFGAIIGDNTHTGCNVVTNPGTLIGKDCNIYSNAVLRGFYKSNQIMKLRQSIDECEKT